MMRPLRHALIALVLLLAFSFSVVIAVDAPVAYAAESHGDGHHGEDDHGNALGGPNATLWKTVNFFILVGIAWYLLRGKVGPFFEERNRAIARDMNAAAEREAAAQARLNAVEEKISGLEAEIASLRENSRLEMERDRERVAAETAQAIARIQENSAREIQSAGAMARAQLSKHAAALALQLSEKQVVAHVSQPGEQDRLLTLALERASQAAKASRN
jgi:F-type H+-transporting ATPase subunit b